jgi:hypothetical protein
LIEVAFLALEVQNQTVKKAQVPQHPGIQVGRLSRFQHPTDARPPDAERFGDGSRAAAGGFLPGVPLGWGIVDHHHKGPQPIRF